MAQTFIVKGDVVSNPTTNDFGKAHFVRITATSDVTGSVFESDGTTQLGQFYLENGDTIIVEKKAEDKITCGTSKGSAVGSPRG